MKILHTSDWHLGKMLFGRSLLEDQAYFIDRVFLPLMERERPDLLLLAGDVFDRQIAPTEAIRLFDRFVSEAHRLHIPLAVISGNHDGAERMTLGADLLRQCGVTIATKIEDAFTPVRLPGHVNLYLLPYFDPVQARQFLGEEVRGFQESYQAVLDKLRASFEPDAVNLLAAHCFVMGGETSSSESPTFVGGSSEVPPACFAGFSYVALGHLHRPQKAGPNGRYAGSPLKYSFDEADHRKSVAMVHIEDGTVETEQIPVQPLRDLRLLSGTMETLLAQGRENPSEDYLYVHLLDESPVYMPMDRLRPYFPNLLGLNSEWLARAGSGDNAGLREQLLHRKTDDTAIFEEFLKQICGTQADDEDRALFRRAMNGKEGAEE
ncbi:exonuclease SbcCD subunit D [Clostridium sp. D33t1_170424_F3]|uniref:exonuclease SbcCD subunit D n=1 Tax=Clostridium sp. D33t1_170424_F3 TaxID=2787099 RepID=UPI0018A9DF66|nr:exonuclease SbcCD subunit D [Clostridium sp. D33t1_170424_F3]